MTIMNLQVLLLVSNLARQGYYGQLDSIHAVLQPLTDLLDGRNDLPYNIDQQGKHIKNF